MIYNVLKDNMLMTRTCTRKLW